jgi:hypothetical protein
MAGGLLTESVALALSDAALLALTAALPTLFVLYVRARLQAGSARPDLSLGKLEEIELRRATLLHEKTCKRREDIFRQRQPLRPPWRAALRARSEFRKTFGAELQELDGYARDLKATIVRLRGRPLQRIKSWIHLNSTRFALGRALCCYCLVLALLGAISYDPVPLLWATGVASFATLSQLQLLDQGLLLANAIAAGVVALVMPPLYLVRRAQLRRWNDIQIRNLREFAAAAPEQSTGQGPSGEEEAAEEMTDGPLLAPVATEEAAWFEVLGVSPSATIDDVKQAYKTLVKRNHPDRVQGMSPVFIRIAEAETKKINSAYAEALMHLRQDALDTPDMCAA